MIRRGLLALLAACGSSSDPPPDPWAAKPSVPVAALATRTLPDGSVVDDLTPVLAPRIGGKAPALGAAVFRGDRLVAIGASGARKLGAPRGAAPVTIDDEWHLGSDTKAMTATLVGLYVDRGLLHWDDTLGALFAGSPVDPSYASVTITQLLRQESGVPDGHPKTTQAMYADERAGLSDARLREALRVLAVPGRGAGTFAYANDNYVLLGVILERATKRTWEDLMRVDLFTPLHMTDCGFGPPPGANPWGHRAGTPMDATDPASDNPRAVGPAGTVHCSLASWGRFAAMHLAGLRGEHTLLSPATMTMLHTPSPGGEYAGGWIHAGPVVGHDGSNTLWYVTAELIPTKNLVLLAASNSGDAQSAVHAVIAELQDRYAPP